MDWRRRRRRRRRRREKNIISSSSTRYKCLSCMYLTHQQQQHKPAALDYCILVKFGWDSFTLDLVITSDTLLLSTGIGTILLPSAERNYRSNKQSGSHSIIRPSYGQHSTCNREKISVLWIQWPSTSHACSSCDGVYTEFHKRRQ